MFFYRERNHPAPSCLWDEKAGREVYAFTRGVCEVPDDDLETIGIMRALGFSDIPLDPQTQMRLNMEHDMAIPQPGPPPKWAEVPAVEPPIKTRVK